MKETIDSETFSEKMLSNLAPETHITLYPLAMHFEDGEYILGRIETGEFIALPEVGGRIIELLQQDSSLGEIKISLQKVLIKSTSIVEKYIALMPLSGSILKTERRDENASYIL